MIDPDEFIPTRHSLLSRLKDWNDQESWKVFFDTYWKLIFNTAIRAGLTEAEAQDVVQETVIAVSKNIPAGVYDRSKGPFKVYLMRQTQWRIMGQLRKRMPIDTSDQPPTGRTSTDTATIERVADPSPSPLDRFWDEEWVKNLMEAAMQRVKKRVDPAQYQIFDLCVLQKWPVSRVVSCLKVNAASVYLAKHRIGKLIKKELEYLKGKLI